jgi:hypothetical protein
MVVDKLSGEKDEVCGLENGRWRTRTPVGFVNGFRDYLD